MKHVQLTSHGPRWEKDGVRFRLWAPTAKKVELVLNDKIIDMPDAGKGWHEVLCANARNGDRYSFRINGDTIVPDPASRYQPEDVGEPSELYDPNGFEWPETKWAGRPWEEAAIYELHVGAFSPEGNYRGVMDRLDYLVALGITAIELMPLADFAGKRGWGYDGVLPYAPDSSYGTPDELKQLINAAHQKGLMVFLDVVYNHFGPAGNYLHLYAASFFTDRYETPWGSAINVEGSEEVRDFFIENALFWLNEYNFDGLRFDAVHAINDTSHTHFLNQLAQTVRARLTGDRYIHLVLENDKNEAHYLECDTAQKARHFNAQWNDDFHHCMHTLLTGEDNGYYSDYKNQSLHCLGRALAEGFTYQGEASEHRHGEKRGEPSKHLPPQAFVSFLQNHDQIGNRALGDRLVTLTSKEQLLLGSTILLLSPQPPLLFMGEEWQSTQPWLYFCNFEGELADAVREGRRKEFASFPEFSHPAARSKIPDPNAEETFKASSLDWAQLNDEIHKAHIAYTAKMLELRQQHIWPLLKTRWVKNNYEALPETGFLRVEWEFEKAHLTLIANFSENEIQVNVPVDATHIWGVTGDRLPPWKCSWYVRPHHV